MRYDPRYLRSGTFTSGRAANPGGKWMINNAGWNSPVDYSESTSKPLIAIIGDSYVEAFAVNSDENFAGVLRNLLRDNYRVYSFGISGAPLSQYLQMSRYVQKHFHPDVLVVCVVHNDFDESLAKFSSAPFFLRITGEPGHFQEVAPQPYSSKPWKRMLKRSAIVRYVYENLSVWKRFPENAERPQLKNYVANIDATSVNQSKAIIEDATYFIVDKIRMENPQIPILFMMDALRQEIYSGANEKSPIQWMNELMKNASAKNNCYFLDLTTSFKEDFRKNHMMFNNNYDWHWNKHGHSVAGKELFEKMKTLGIVH